MKPSEVQVFFVAIDDYVKDDRPREVRPVYNFYHHPLQP